jgi:hypothetical protein
VLNAQWIVSKEGFLGEFRKKSIVGSWEELAMFPSEVLIPQQAHLTGTTIPFNVF